MIVSRGAGRAPGFALLAALACAPVALGAQAPARLSLLDVPFLSQSEALCGGAAAAMVLRYWGARGVAAEDFAPLVQRVEGGIATSVLAGAVRDRGFAAHEVHATPERLQVEVAAARPVIVLLEDRPGTFHYVVVVGWHADAIVLHDPARAPFRVMTSSEFGRRWRRARGWALVVTPGSDRLNDPDRGSDLGTDSARSSDRECEAMVAEGVQLAQGSALQEAERVLAEAVLRCGGAAPRRELAGVRLLQQRWTEVRELAAESLRLEPGDPHATRLLGTGRYLDGDAAGALEAWNAIGEPRVDLVTIEGLSRTRHRVVERLLAVPPGGLVTSGLLARSSRRLSELPSVRSSRVDYVPAPGGRAELHARMSERPVAPRGLMTLGVLGLRAVATREAVVDIAGATGGGELLSARWRFWPNRPRYTLSVAAPAPWGGVWRVDGFDERQPFTSTLPDTNRSGVRLAFGEWTSGGVRLELRAGGDRWRGHGRFAAVGGAIALVSKSNTLRIDTRLDIWSGRSMFGTGGVTAAWRSSPEPRGPAVLARAGLEAATTGTPPDVWPAGDTGHARNLWLRAHPVLHDGRLRVDRLGRLVLNASIEAQHWWTAGPVRLAGALFVDGASTARRLAGEAVDDVDAGAGVRIALPGSGGVLRLDAAHGLRDGHHAVSVGWTDGW